MDQQTQSLPITRRQATAAKSSGLRAPSPAKTPSRKKGARSKEGREVIGKKGAKEKGAGPTFLQRWLTASGGTPEDSSEAGKRKDC